MKVFLSNLLPHLKLIESVIPRDSIIHILSNDDSQISLYVETVAFTILRHVAIPNFNFNQKYKFSELISILNTIQSSHIGDVEITLDGRKVEYRGDYVLLPYCEASSKKINSTIFYGNYTTRSFFNVTYPNTYKFANKIVTGTVIISEKDIYCYNDYSAYIESSDISDTPFMLEIPENKLLSLFEKEDVIIFADNVSNESLVSFWMLNLSDNTFIFFPKIPTATAETSKIELLNSSPYDLKVFFNADQLVKTVTRLSNFYNFYPQSSFIIEFYENDAVFQILKDNELVSEQRVFCSLPSPLKFKNFEISLNQLYRIINSYVGHFKLEDIAIDFQSADISKILIQQTDVKCFLKAKIHE